MSDWETEVAELHACFEAYFLGTLPDDLSRVETALAPDFSMVGPHGNESNRSQVIAALKAGYNRTDSLTIGTSDYQLLHESDEFVIASYTESHDGQGESSHRRATVVFRRDVDGPNGLRWIRVHECFIEAR